jgi:hypothetical protein
MRTPDKFAGASNRFLRTRTFDQGLQCVFAGGYITVKRVRRDRLRNNFKAA